MDTNSGGFLPGNARVVMGIGTAGPSEMTVHEIEGIKTQTLDEQTELAFWARVRAKAQAKAKEILNQAMADAEAIREQARQEGLQQGLADSRQACEAELSAMGGSLAVMLQGLEADRANLWARHRQEFAALLRLAVEKTLHTELGERRQEVLGNLMDQAIELLDTRQGFTVLVNPDDEQVVGVLLEEAKKAHPSLGAWRIKTDPAMTPGGIRLESEAGMVDNTLDTRFEQISDLLSRVEFNEGQP
ncbi:FliH/SctL family protein [Fundidesulfovibrio terrae]|uniref:FliH/SctL family protein n=1 Tax=Fundidesulfovibrio terrae TaxID=2922866 RepID=UPI001FAE8148|nr:FliH/SctL family protein [Fundidesulfovibrio terrae]